MEIKKKINVSLTLRELKILTSVFSDHVDFLESEGHDENSPILMEQYNEAKELLNYLEDCID